MAKNKSNTTVSAESRKAAAPTVVVPDQVVPDANILFSATLRDVFMWLHWGNCIQVRWSADIDNEWSRNVIKRNRMTTQQVADCVKNMRLAAPDWEITNYMQHVGLFPTVHHGDQHVASAAYQWTVEDPLNQPLDVALVTRNTKHFPLNAFASNTVHRFNPDMYLAALFKKKPECVKAAIDQLHARFRNPPKAKQDIIALLVTNGCKKFAQLVAAH